MILERFEPRKEQRGHFFRRSACKSVEQVCSFIWDSAAHFEGHHRRPKQPIHVPWDVLQRAGLFEVSVDRAARRRRNLEITPAILEIEMGNQDDESVSHEEFSFLKPGRQGSQGELVHQDGHN